MNWFGFVTLMCSLSVVSGLCQGAPIQSSVGNFTSGFGTVDADFQARIAQGVLATDLATPWMVSLRGQSGSQFCGGVVLDDRHILTAAHCVVRFSASEIRATVNAVDYSVERIWIPETYRWSQLNADIAVLALTDIIPNAVPLAFVEPADTASLQTGTQLKILGFGQTETNGDLSPVLFQGSVPFVSVEECVSAWRTDFPTLADLIARDGICAGGGGGLVDTCTGDSGGPLLVERGGLENEVRLLGVTSFGEASCGGAIRPSVYTRVSAFEQEIEKAVKGEAYYANWAQGLVEFSGMDTRRISVQNSATVDWSFRSLAVESSIFRLKESSCLNVVLQPGQVCDLVFEFHPTSGGFFSERLELLRANADPIFINLQGLAYETVNGDHFGSDVIIAFAGGEENPEVQDLGGISDDGYIAWNGVDALNTVDVFIGVEQAGDIRVFLDFLPVQGDQEPVVELQLLNEFEEDIPFELDSVEGWQSLTVSIEEPDFLLMRFQAKGRGFQGEMRLDIAVDSEEVRQDFNAQSQAFSSGTQRDVALGTGGSLDFWLGLVLSGLAVNRILAPVLELIKKAKLAMT